MARNGGLAASATVPRKAIPRPVSLAKRAPIPSAARTSTVLGVAGRVLVLVCGAAAINGFCYLTQGQIASEVDSDRRTAGRVLNAFAAEGLLVARRNVTHNGYTFPVVYGPPQQVGGRS